MGIWASVLAGSHVDPHRRRGDHGADMGVSQFYAASSSEQQFIEHAIGAREITALTLTTPVPLRSPASQMVVESGILAMRAGAESLLTIEFDRYQQKESVDLRPHLPVILRF